MYILRVEHALTFLSNFCSCGFSFLTIVFCVCAKEKMQKRSEIPQGTNGHTRDSAPKPANTKSKQTSSMSASRYSPSLYEINTRVFLNEEAAKRGKKVSNGTSLVYTMHPVRVRTHTHIHIMRMRTRRHTHRHAGIVLLISRFLLPQLLSKRLPHQLFSIVPSSIPHASLTSCHLHSASFLIHLFFSQVTLADLDDSFLDNMLAKLPGKFDYIW